MSILYRPCKKHEKVTLIKISCPDCENLGELTQKLEDTKSSFEALSKDMAFLQRSLEAAEKDRKESDLQLRETLFILGRMEVHCPCGARPESPTTHPHVTGCLLAEAIEKLEGRVAQKRVESPKCADFAHVGQPILMVMSGEQGTWCSSCGVRLS